jgi:Uma2 family endonuclease
VKRRQPVELDYRVVRAVEVLSMGSARYDSTVKLSRFQQHGVRECWLVDPVTAEVNVVSFAGSTRSLRVYGEDDLVQSDVLPGLCLPASDLFT